jgi:cytosine deaminase
MEAAPPRSVAVRLPRALLDPGPVAGGDGRPLPAGDDDGLLAVELSLADGRIAAIRALTPAAGPQGQLPLPLALPPLLDAHAHLDKAFSWAAFPNRAGSMEGALSANRREAAERRRETVLDRGERALQQGWRHGLRAIRSHIDSGGPQERPSWEALLELRRRWQGRLELQLVALVPLEHWTTAEGDALARRLATSGDLLGAVLGPPFAEGYRQPTALRQLLRLADRLGCGLDLHIDEADTQPGRGLSLLLRELQRTPVTVPITCSHCSSLALLGEPAQRRLAAGLAARGVAVVALPTTNLWLLGRRRGLSAALRPIAPLRLLQQEGVTCAIGGDNVQDPWYPAGDLDPIELLRLSLPALQLAPWQRQGLMPFSTAAARLMGLSWDGVLRPGAPADLVVLAASGWSELLARAPQRRVLRAGRWLEPPPHQRPDPRLASLGAAPCAR